MPTKENTGTDHLRELALAGKLVQLAAPTKGHFPTGDTYLAEPKLDGWRIACHVHEDGLTLYSRSGQTYSGRMPEVEAALLRELPAGTWLDGEAVAIRFEDGKAINEWGTTQSIMSTANHAFADKISYAVFDVIAHAGIDARGLAFFKRRLLLDRMFERYGFAEQVFLTPIHEAAETTYSAMLAMGFEGIVVKTLDRPYASNRREGGGWHKAKPTTTIEGVVMGFTPGKDGFTGLIGAVVFGQYDESGKLVERGRVSGMDMRTRIDMTKHPEKYIGKVIEVKHEGVNIGQKSSGDRFRFPRMKRLRLDRSPESVGIHDA